MNWPFIWCLYMAHIGQLNSKKDTEFIEPCLYIQAFLHYHQMF